MIYERKIRQIADILKDLDIDAWIVFVRETGQQRDPALRLLTDLDFTWTSALMFLNTGERIAVVGNMDANGAQQTGLFSKVVPYHTSMDEDFVTILEDLMPSVIAVNTSVDDPFADGLTHHMYQRLTGLLDAANFKYLLVSSEEILYRLRGEKLEEELFEIRRAVQIAEEIFDDGAKMLHSGQSELEIFSFFQNAAAERNVELAWTESQCPGVMAGPDSAAGHTGPSACIVFQPGDVMTVDFGVKAGGYCSDLQRVYYALKDGEQEAPPAAVRAFDTLREAIKRAAQAMIPGACAEDIDGVARDYVISQGYSEWPYALGHEVGMRAHDGGAVLAPAWPRYGASVSRTLRAGQIFTLEPGIRTDLGYVGLEEMVVVTHQGAVFLSRPQCAIYTISSS